MLQLRRRVAHTASGCPTHSRSLCPVPRHALQFVPGHPLQFCLPFGPRQPALDGGRALVVQIEFSNQGAAVVHQHPLLDSLQLYPFSAKAPLIFQRFPWRSSLPWQSSFNTFGPSGILPARGTRVVAARALPPHAGGRLHSQSFMRTHMVVLPAIGIQPCLRLFLRVAGVCIPPSFEHSLRSASQPLACDPGP